MSKVKLSLSDPHIRTVWNSVLETKREVASWPAWKRGEISLADIVDDGAKRFDEKPLYRASIDARAELASRQGATMPKSRVIRTVNKSSVRLDGGRMYATLRIVADRKRQPASSDSEHWWVRDVALTPKAARALRDQLDAWLATVERKP